MFNPNFFEKNRGKLSANFNPNDLLIFTANGLIQRSGSTTYPYKQDSNFWYLSGVVEPDILLVISDEEKYFILPSRSEVYEKFNGKISPKDLAEKSGVTDVYDYDEGFKKLKLAVLRAKQVVTFLPLDVYVSAAGFFSNPSRRRLVNLIKGIKSDVNIIDARPQLAKLRMIKEPEELQAIEQAVSISTASFTEIKKNINNYKTEKQLMTGLTAEFIKNGADGHAYEPVVASGKNACVLHYAPQERKLETGQLVLIDAGAETLNYASDITRTYALSTPTSRQTEIFDLVMTIRKYALELLRPGQVYKSYETSVKNFAAETVKKLKLNNPDTSVYYPHSTSHFIGLDVHDAADYEAALMPMMVMTVEPGVYIEEEGIGIRIEDNVLITETGYKNLSEQLPRELI